MPARPAPYSKSAAPNLGKGGEAIALALEVEERNSVAGNELVVVGRAVGKAGSRQVAASFAVAGCVEVPARYRNLNFRADPADMPL